MRIKKEEQGEERGEGGGECGLMKASSSAIHVAVRNGFARFHFAYISAAGARGGGGGVEGGGKSSWRWTLVISSGYPIKREAAPTSSTPIEEPHNTRLMPHSEVSFTSVLKREEGGGRGWERKEGTVRNK